MKAPIAVLLTALVVCGLLVVKSSMPEENDYSLVCYSGDGTVYQKTSPDYLDVYTQGPMFVIVEDDEDGTTVILNAACVWKEP